MGDSDTVKVPRPGPGQYAIIACAEDDATASITVTAPALKDGPFMACVPSLLDEAQQKLRDTCPNPAG